MRGVEGIKTFSRYLLEPYQQLPPGKEEIKAEIARLEARITELKDQLSE